MTVPFVLAVPSKGRLQENAEAFFTRAGLTLAKPGGARDYRGTIPGLDNVEIAYLSASEIAANLARGAVHLDQKLQSPSARHWFGTDEVGTDIYTRVVLGARVSLQIGLIITLLATVIGVPLGIIAGYVGGPLGEVIMRVTDVFLSVPALVLALAIVGALGPGIVNAIVALGLVWWPGYVRLVQSKTLALKGQVFVEAARAIGTGRLRIVFAHILPNCVSPITVKASMDMGSAILAAAGLGFIGLGAQPPYPEWGAMISHGRNYLPTWWWYSAFPGLFIYLTVLGFNLLGDGLRDILDPQSRG